MAAGGAAALRPQILTSFSGNCYTNIQSTQSLNRLFQYNIGSFTPSYFLLLTSLFLTQLLKFISIIYNISHYYLYDMCY